MQNFISFLMVLILFEISEKFPKGWVYNSSKMSLQETIVPGRLRSDLCPWGVQTLKVDVQILLQIRQFFTRTMFLPKEHVLAVSIQFIFHSFEFDQFFESFVRSGFSKMFDILIKWRCNSTCFDHWHNFFWPWDWPRQSVPSNEVSIDWWETEESNDCQKIYGVHII